MPIHIITGPPAAGKSTYVKQHRQLGDITIDYDALANTFAGLEPANHQHTKHIKAVTQAARKAAMDTAIDKHDGTYNIWIIHSTPSQRTLDKYRAQGAEIHTIDPGKDTVMARCKTERPAHMLKIAAAWYDKHTKSKETNTTKRGYGHTHQKQRRILVAQHIDGTPCEECGKPMYKEPDRNFDHAALEADHGPGHALKYTNNKRQTLATRLLHRTCNRSGGAWDRPTRNVGAKNDGQTPAITW